MPWSRNLLFVLIILSTTIVSCMHSQASFQSQQPPLLEVPADAVSTTASPQPMPTEIQNMRNPIAADPKSLKTGQTLYTTYCATCHGQDARGDGPVGKLLKPPPADLTAAFMDHLTDGQIFLFISNGIGGMPPFRYDLSEDQRWNIINYVRSLRKR